MNRSELLPGLRQWFQDYIRSFDRSDADVLRNFNLKEHHSYRVCDEIVAIARSLNMDAEDTALAEIAALFHDVGRFEQFFRYRTFMDPASEDHCALGVRVLHELRPLAVLAPEDEQMVIRAVAAHGQRNIPPSYQGRERHITMMLRDADKLDIWRIVIDYYRAPIPDPTIKLGLSDELTVSPKVFRDLLDHRVADKHDLRTVSDFQLCQTAWVYDLNFPWSRRAVRERGYLCTMSRVMAPLPEVHTIYGRAQAYLYGN